MSKITLTNKTLRILIKENVITNIQYLSKGNIINTLSFNDKYKASNMIIIFMDIEHKNIKLIHNFTFSNNQKYSHVSYSDNN